MSDYNIIYPKTLIENSTPLTYETWNSSTDSIIGINDDQEFALSSLISTACENIFIMPVVKNVENGNGYYINLFGITKSAIENIFNAGALIILYTIDISNDSRRAFELTELDYFGGNLILWSGVAIDSSGNIDSYGK